MLVLGAGAHEATQALFLGAAKVPFELLSTCKTRERARSLDVLLSNRGQIWDNFGVIYTIAFKKERQSH